VELWAHYRKLDEGITVLSGYFKVSHPDVNGWVEARAVYYGTKLLLACKMIFVQLKWDGQ